MAARSVAEKREREYQKAVRLSQHQHALKTLERNLARRLQLAAKLEAAIEEAARQWRLLNACNERACMAFPSLPPAGGVLEPSGLRQAVAAELHRQGAGPMGDLGVRRDLSFPGAEVDGFDTREFRDRPEALPPLTERLKEANDYTLAELRRLIASGQFDGNVVPEPEAEPVETAS